MPKEQTIVVISDMQIPYHNRRAVDGVIEFLKNYQPDVLVNVGDDIDSPEVSYWCKGTAMEYGKTLQKAFDDTAKMHSRFREAIGDVPYHISRSNHGDRLQKYIKKYAPALDGLWDLRIDRLCGYWANKVDYHTEPFVIAPGWVVAHGDEGTLSPLAGRTAAGLARRWGVSVVCGHTHRAGLAPTTTGYAGRVSQTLWGFEVGHLMDVSKATYLKGGHADWQTAFGILHVLGRKVHAELIPVQKDGTFCVGGWWFGRKPEVPEVQSWIREAAGVAE